jgi:hypothetical protein
MLMEAGQRLLITKCIQYSLGFWNRLTCFHESSLMGKAVRENLCIEGHGWCHALSTMLHSVAGHSEPLIMENGRLVVFSDMDSIMEAVHTTRDAGENRAHAHILDATQGSGGNRVRGCPDRVSEGFKTFKYRQWFFSGYDDAPILSHILDVRDIRVLARFRCGMHWLATEKYRKTADGTAKPRSQRVCPCCTSQEREDEVHILFCEAYALLRNEFPYVFAASSLYAALEHSYRRNNALNLDQHMRGFMSHADASIAKGFVSYLRKSIKIRDNIIG